MHTCIFGGDIVRDEDGAVVPMVGAGYARRSPSPLPTERALSSSEANLAVGRICPQQYGAAAKASEAGPRAVLRWLPRL